MEGSELSFTFVIKLIIRCEKVNVPKSLSFIKSPDWLYIKMQ